MSINRSEQFLYFQNKSRHYDNIRKSKPTVDDQLCRSLRKTIDHSAQQTRRKLSPHLRKYELEVENQKMINRLVGIVHSKRKEINVQGDYSRYHHVPREFRTRNPYRDQVNRRIEAENQGIVAKLANVKPMVGSTSEWMNQYQRKLSHRKNLSRYLDSQRSKGSLLISTEKFVPEHYKNLLDISSGKNSAQNAQSLESSQKISHIKIIPKQKLIVLPRLLNKQRSDSSLSVEKSRCTLDV